MSTLPVIFRRVARAEFDAAADWYEGRQAGLGAAFTAAVQQVLDRIAAQPDLYPQVYGDVREALVPGFPYCVYYRDEPGRVLVLAVFHTARDPAIWQGRA
jgi:toxin ParE1/3/4